MKQCLLQVGLILLFLSSAFAHDDTDCLCGSCDRSVSGYEEKKKEMAAGSIDAQLSLICLYQLGDFVDYKESFDLALNLAKKGNGHAAFEMGRFYYFGLGVPRDYIKAYAWFNVGKARGSKFNFTLTEIEEKMTTQQVAEAQKLSRKICPECP